MKDKPCITLTIDVGRVSRVHLHGKGRRTRQQIISYHHEELLDVSMSSVPLDILVPETELTFHVLRNKDVAQHLGLDK